MYIFHERIYYSVHDRVTEMKQRDPRGAAPAAGAVPPLLSGTHITVVRLRRTER